MTHEAMQIEALVINNLKECMADLHESGLTPGSEPIPVEHIGLVVNGEVVPAERIGAVLSGKTRRPNDG